MYYWIYSIFYWPTKYNIRKMLEIWRICRNSALPDPMDYCAFSRAAFPANDIRIHIGTTTIVHVVDAFWIVFYFSFTIKRTMQPLQGTRYHRHYMFFFIYILFYDLPSLLCLRFILCMLFDRNWVLQNLKKSLDIFMSQELFF